MRLFLQCITFELSHLIELMYLGNNVFALLICFQKFGIQDTFSGFTRRKVVILGGWIIGIILFLLAVFLYVEVGLTKRIYWSENSYLRLVYVFSSFSLLTNSSRRSKSSAYSALYLSIRSKSLSVGRGILLMSMLLLKSLSLTRSASLFCLIFWM